MMKTVIHVDESEKWPMAQGNARNLVAYCQERGLDWTVEIVVNGGAVVLLTSSSSVRGLEELLTLGVVVAACNNALQGNGIDPADLCPGVTVVPAGVVELVRRQGEGYAYIKP